MTTTTDAITAAGKLIHAIALAEDLAQDAEDREQLGRAYKFRAQARAMRVELAALESSSK